MSEYNLIEELREADLDYFVPSDEDIEEALENLDEYDENAYFGTKGDLYDNDEDEYDEDKEAGWDRKRMTFAGFCQTFGIKEYEDESGNLVTIEDQLNQSFNEILGITKPQLAFIDQDLVCTPDKMQGFVENMRRNYLKEHYPDVEERIIMATILTYEGERIAEGYYDQALRLYKSEKDFGKALEKINLWLDYNDMYDSVYTTLQDFWQIKGISELRDVFDNTFREGEYPKPSHVKDLHDKMARFQQLLEGTLAEKNRAEKDPLLKEITKSPLYKKFVFKDDRFAVCIIRDYDELAREGREQDNCVLEYAQSIIDDTSLIYAIRSNDAPNKPLYTVEIRRGETLHDGQAFRLTQCYGYGNTTEKSPELREFIIKWCKAKGLKIECPL